MLKILDKDNKVKFILSDDDDEPKEVKSEEIEVQDSKDKPEEK
jgi:hypothetical protein